MYSVHRKIVLLVVNYVIYFTILSSSDLSLSLGLCLCIKSASASSFFLHVTHRNLVEFSFL